MEANNSSNQLDNYLDISHLKSLEGFYDSQFEIENENENKSSKSEEISEKINTIPFNQNSLNESLDFIHDLKIMLKTENDDEIEKIHLEDINKYIEHLFDLGKKAYFRYIKRDENNKINNIFSNCQFIPLIKLEKDKILFHDGNGKGKYFNLKEIITFYNKLFIKEDEINNNKEIIEIFNEGYICKNHNENYDKFCNKCKVNICKDCTRNHIDHEIFGPNEKIKKILRICQKKLNSIVKKDNFLVRKNKIKITNFNEICIKIIYCVLMKKIIREKLLMKNKFNYNIEQNIINAYKLIEEGKIKTKRKNKNNKEYLPKYSIIWMTEFYSKKQINNNINQNKNIWISISSSRLVIIYLFNLLKDSKIGNLEEIFIQINQKEFDITNPGKIMRLEKCFNPNDKEKNYFLIGSFYDDKSIIISVTHDYKKIEEVQSIINKGLISSMEIKIQNKYCLIQSKNNNFNLWYYENINNNKDNNNINNSINDEKGLNYRIINTIIEKEELKTKITNENNEFIIRYREIISYVISKNLLIVHIFSSEPYLLFYKINQDKKLNIILFDQIKPREDQNKFSISHNNFIIIENKFLIIGAKSNDSNKYGGFYVINLDKIEISYYYQEPRCLFFNSFLKYQNNMFICSTCFRTKNPHNLYRLILYEFIIDKNEKMKIIKKYTKIGKYFKITNTSIISDSFLISSTHRTNSLVKINNDIITLCSENELDNIYIKNKDTHKEKINMIIFNK